MDIYHALEHLEPLIETLLGKSDERRIKRWRHRWGSLLRAEGPQRIIKHARKQAVKLGRDSEALERVLGYFVRNQERMQYGQFRARGYFIGSGVVEAGCRSIIGARCKQSGMFWSQQGAAHILALRCIHASARLESFWHHHLAQRTASNHSPLKSAA